MTLAQFVAMVTSPFTTMPIYQIKSQDCPLEYDFLAKDDTWIQWFGCDMSPMFLPETSKYTFDFLELSKKDFVDLLRQ